MSTKTSAQRTVARIAMASVVAAIPFTLAAAPASAEPASPSVTEVRHDKWDKHDRDKWDRRDCGPWGWHNSWDPWNKCDRWPGHNPWGPPFWRPFPSGSFGSS
ncbi:hypothetical protein IU433_31030 [Nocardia puris]|uniref:Secreted protein n=2 Tax=Nocardia puris TaxID=208602 RepID=A0A366E417_9NOCA|nr:hypothetical protein [Nocardia puris]MBF6215371.1 hypothetical protein [Nocardia puris]MBF6369775.1 hypothetical protein [Nocardia puris]MBF6463434.1 hypothetical protein [Nocardia puris]RBO96855.1 hypothetical protein DFR74_101874 [Nocardia puris]